MASATLTKPPPPLHPPQPTQPQSQPNHRHLFSSSSQGAAAEPNQAAPPSRHPLPAFSSAGPPARTPSKASFDHPGNSAQLQSKSQPLPPQSQPHPSSQPSFSMSQPPSQKANSARTRGYHQFATSQSIHMEDDDLPQIYSSVYSGVEVYEMEVNNVAVMRRRDDSCLNATQILKVAGLDKGKRTKILEKEIQTGEHEKVQGGYGKYQGTWISFERGVEVCRQYGVEELLRPLLTYDMGQDGGVAGRGDLNTPTKEQAMAAQRKKLYSAPVNNRPNSYSGTFFKNISSTASNAVAAISKARLDSPGPRNGGGLSRAPSFNRQASMQSLDDFPGNSQQSFVSESGRNVDSAYATQRHTRPMSIDGPEPPRKRQRVTVTPANSFGHSQSQSMQMYADNFPGSPTEPNESFIHSQAGINLHDRTEHDGATALPPLPFDKFVDAEVTRKTLLSLFAEPAEPNAFEELRSLTPTELDMPIDSQHHTALHWAATLSRMNIIQALIKHGANPFRVNSEGQTALMRAVIVTNCHDNFSFPELLDLLGHTLEVADNKGRTVLHHIVVTSAIERRHATSKYYLDCLLEWVVRQGSVPSSQDHGVNGNGPLSSIPHKIGLGRFMTDVVNAQDKVGDTALNLAARISNRSIISQLIEVHADATIPNRVGLRPSDFGVGQAVECDRTVADTDKNDILASTQRSKESSDDIVTFMQDLLGETAAIAQEELKKKQESLDEHHSSLRAASAKLGETRRNLETVRGKLKQQQLNRQKVLNMSRELESLQYSMGQVDQPHASLQSNSAAGWEDELDAVVKDLETNGQSVSQAPALPDANILRARLKATGDVLGTMKNRVSGLKGSSRDIEFKYRRLVALAANCHEDQVDQLIEGLVRAVESEKGELEISRVKKFLGGVDGV